MSGWRKRQITNKVEDDMKVDSIDAYNNRMQHLHDIKITDKKHYEKVQDEKRVIENHKVDEAKRIEMNRKMNRPGQNIDKIA
jgi:hypothetical protein